MITELTIDLRRAEHRQWCFLMAKTIREQSILTVPDCWRRREMMIAAERGVRVIEIEHRPFARFTQCVVVTMLKVR